MVKTKQMMETDPKTGVKRQFFPISHAGAILGLKEFLEGDLFQADFDRVMAQLLEHSNKIFEEIDEKSEEIEKHADQKIAEFDGKIAATDQALAQVEKDIYDTQQALENMDVFTKAESSANVINQIIGKEKAQIKLSTDFVGKIVGSVAENANSIKIGARSTIMLPSEFVYGAAQANYDRLTAIDNINFPLNSVTNGAFVQKLFDYDVVRMIDEKLGETFWKDKNISSRVDKVAFIKTNFISSTGIFWNYAISPSGNMVRMDVFNNSTGALETKASHSNASITKSIIVLDSADYITNDGHIYFVASAQKSDGVKTSSLLTDYVSLDILLNVSANDHINSMIAQYHRENQKYTFEKIGEV